MAYHIENNDSQLMGIKKQEYLRVLANIVNESRQEQVCHTDSLSRAYRNSGKWSIRPLKAWFERMSSPKKNNELVTVTLFIC